MTPRLRGHNPCHDGEHTFVWGNYGCSSPRIVAECITCHQFLLGFDPATDVSVDLEGSMADQKIHGPTADAVMRALDAAEYDARQRGNQHVASAFETAKMNLKMKLPSRLTAEGKLVACPVCGGQPQWRNVIGDEGHYGCRHSGMLSIAFDPVAQGTAMSEPKARRWWNDVFGERLAPQLDPVAIGVGLTICAETMDLASDMARCATDLRLALLENRELDSGPTEQYARWCEQQARDLFASLWVNRKAS